MHSAEMSAAMQTDRWVGGIPAVEGDSGPESVRLCRKQEPDVGIELIRFAADITHGAQTTKKLARFGTPQAVPGPGIFLKWRLRKCES